MDTLGRVKMRCWKSQFPVRRKLPYSNSTLSFEMKRKPISLPLSFVSPAVDAEQSDAVILATAPSESNLVLVHVRFVLQKKCVFGERFYLVGDNPLVGCWDPSNGMPLDWSDGDIWSAQLDLPLGEKVEFKFVLVTLSGEVHWQPGPNRVLLQEQVIASTNSKASMITVWEDWDLADNQRISLEEVAVSEEAGVMQNEIQIAGPDCDGSTSEISVKIRDNPELIQGDVHFGTISRKSLEGSELDSKSNSGGMILVPGLNPEKVVTQEDDRIKPLETEDGNNSSVMETTMKIGATSKEEQA